MIQQQQLKHLQQRLLRTAQQHVLHSKQRLQVLMQALHVISPLATLERGYSILSTSAEQHIIRSVQEVHTSQQLQARLTDGLLTLQVSHISANPQG